jgi:hypothetical protein
MRFSFIVWFVGLKVFLYKYIVRDDEVPLKRLAAGGFSGALAALICNPTDLIKIRMQSSGSCLVDVRVPASHSVL